MGWRAFSLKFQVIVPYLEEIKAGAYCITSIVKNRENKYLGPCLFALSQFNPLLYCPRPANQKMVLPKVNQLFLHQLTIKATPTDTPKLIQIILYYDSSKVILGFVKLRVKTNKHTRRESVLQCMILYHRSGCSNSMDKHLGQVYHLLREWTPLG